jgi:hypothetical protein
MMKKARFLILGSDENTIISEPPLVTHCLYKLIIGISAYYTLRSFLKFYPLIKMSFSSLLLHLWAANMTVVRANTRPRALAQPYLASSR